jgi:hypothetical protein
MNKKNNVKCLLILLIIISMNINCFAAISVSDGSSFVSKAEFSSDFSNISNRLSQVENSLEAKIDSLVSAYLNRNGIWNGSDQLSNLFKANNISFIFGLQGSRTSTDAMSIFKALTINDTLINSGATINKTGLMIIAHKFQSSNTETYLWTKGGTGVANGNYKTNIYCAIRIKTNAANSQYIERAFLDGLAADCEAMHYTDSAGGEKTYQPDSTTGTERAGYGTVRLIYSSDWAAQDIMFVQKDTNLQYEIIATASGNPGSTWIGASSTTSNFGKYTVTSVAVY